MDLIESLACNDVDNIGLAIITIPVHVYLTFKHVQLSDVDHFLDGFLDGSVDFSRKLRHGERHNVRSTHSSEWVSGSSGGSVALAALATTAEAVGTGRQVTTSASVSLITGPYRGESKTAGRVELKSTAGRINGVANGSASRSSSSERGGFARLANGCRGRFTGRKGAISATGG